MVVVQEYLYTWKYPGEATGVEKNQQFYGQK